MVAGTHSGCGKTSVALGLMAALRKRGLKVAPFKVGPDFIDPGYHKVVCLQPSHNLDTWMNDKATVRQIFSQGCKGADIAVIEGAMGLYDGAGGRYGPGASAHVAKVLGIPVLLVVDSSHMAASVAALVKGFTEFDTQVRFVGILINKVASDRHEQIIRRALEGSGFEWCACLRRNGAIKIPSRHLGLVTVHDQNGIDDLLSDLGSWVEQYCDIEALLKILASCSVPLAQSTDLKEEATSDLHGPSIGVARDEAFCFYYQANLDMFNFFGAKLTFFSPLKDAHLPQNVQALYFGGGYPELYAEELSENSSMLREIKKASRSGMPIYGECGGFIYLCNGIQKENGKQMRWCGIFPFWIKMEHRFQALGYREVTTVKNSIIGKCGIKLRGHEFHYSRLVPDENGPVPDQIYEVRDADGLTCQSPGWTMDNTLGSYIHVHMGSSPEAVHALVKAAASFRK